MAQDSECKFTTRPCPRDEGANETGRKGPAQVTCSGTVQEEGFPARCMTWFKASAALCSITAVRGQTRVAWGKPAVFTARHNHDSSRDQFLQDNGSQMRQVRARQGKQTQRLP
jgi:hypothetical protein